ncbi:MAG TPA: peptide deformylase [Gammaproteobacteria bacterium]|nr:peptide deformylase [Gammaproteobacteria bacterium]
MSVKPVLKIGNPLLNKISEPVAKIDEELKQGLIQDMLDTMSAESGAGIAAPQIGVFQRVIIFGIEKNPRYPDAEPVPTTILINPEITPMSNEKLLGWEGCLSVPGFRGEVERYASIKYTGFDENGIRLERIVSGFHAVVVQHEVDHLDGVLYVQRIKDMQQFGLTVELEEAGRINKIQS